MKLIARIDGALFKNRAPDIDDIWNEPAMLMLDIIAHLLAHIQNLALLTVCLLKMMHIS